MKQSMPSTYWWYKRHKSREWEVVRIDEAGVWSTGMQRGLLTGMAKMIGTFGAEIKQPDNYLPKRRPISE